MTKRSFEEESKRVLVNFFNNIHLIKKVTKKPIYQICADAGVALSTWDNMVQKETLPNLSTVVAIASSLGIDTADLLKDKTKDFWKGAFE